MNLRSLDLNLLPIFEAVYVEGSLTRAAEVLHMTQPAVSNALKRLREAFDDPLFVRSGRGIVPTPTADSLIEPIRDSLGRLQSGLERSREFDASGSSRLFQISAGDVGEAAIAVGLATYLQSIAPNVRLSFRRFDRDVIPHMLSTGELDLAIDTEIRRTPGLATTRLLSEEYVCAVRHEHPMTGKKLSLKRFLSLRHIVVTNRKRGGTAAEIALRRKGLKLNANLRFPSYAPAFRIVRDTDYALVAPACLAHEAQVAGRDLPFDCPPVVLHLYWSKNRQSEPGHVWLREQMLRFRTPR